MAKIVLEKDSTKQDLRDNVQQAITELDLIIANASALTLDQARQAIGKLARYQKIVIKRLARMVE